MEDSVSPKVVMIAWTIVINMIGFVTLLLVTIGDIGSTLVILTVVNSVVILWRKLDKIQKLLEKNNNNQQHPA